MARRATGRVLSHVGKDGRTYRALRFTAYGKRRYVSLGAVSPSDADTALRHTLADVERGVWQPPRAVEPPAEEKPIPTFHQFAEQWWALHEREWAPKTVTDYRWRLEAHLLPYFKDYPLDRITFDLVEQYLARKLGETERTIDGDKVDVKPLCASSINKTVILLAAILETALERRLIQHNPAKGRKRRVKERAPRRGYLDAAWQIEALLTAAGELDAEATKERAHVERRAMLATLAFAGLRIGELCDLRWRNVDLATGWLHTGSKTEAGDRDVKIRGALRDELLSIRARRSIEQTGYVFPTRSGARMSPDNVRSRVLGGSVKRANENLAKNGQPPLPAGVTPHSLRRTFCSVLYALGEDPGIVMDEMGHTDPALALRVYRQAMRRGDVEKAALRALVEGADSADIGSPAESDVAEGSQAQTA